MQSSLRNAAPFAMASKRFYTVGENNKTSILVEAEDGPGAFFRSVSCCCIPVRLMLTL